MPGTDISKSGWGEEWAGLGEIVCFSGVHLQEGGGQGLIIAPCPGAGKEPVISPSPTLLSNPMAPVSLPDPTKPFWSPPTTPQTLCEEGLAVKEIFQQGKRSSREHAVSGEAVPLRLKNLARDGTAHGEREKSKCRLQERQAMENYWDRGIPGASPVCWRGHDRRSKLGVHGKISRLLGHSKE